MKNLISKLLSLLLGPLLAAIAWFVAWHFALGQPACWTAAVTALCAAWWIAEPIPVPATSLLPFALFPLTGVLDHNQVAAAYGDTIVLLFLGGFILSAALEKSGAHRRLAIALLRLIGASTGKRLVLGFMLATAVISLWISNTATVLIMLPIAAAVLEKIDDDKLAAALMLGITYAASIGGVGTPIGSPPNMIFMGVYEKFTGNEISFLQWMKVGIPIVLLFLPAAWLTLTWRLRSKLQITIPTPGPWRPAEARTLIVFSLAATAWVTRTAPFGGWANWLSIPAAGDSTVALLAAATLFLIPDGKGNQLMDWKTAQALPWGLLLLFGSGIAIAAAFTHSGLSQTIGGLLSNVTTWHPFLMILAVCSTAILLTEFTSNTALTTLLMPILASAGMAAKLDPALLMIPAAISASCGFMLPVATPPNAIVMATGHVTVKQMAKAGLALNLIGAAIISAICWLVLGSKMT